ncbi:unnamed protein product, partial [Protopolystoma xenopodis]
MRNSKSSFLLASRSDSDTGTDSLVSVTPVTSLSFATPTGSASQQSGFADGIGYNNEILQPANADNQLASSHPVITASDSGFRYPSARDLDQSVNGKSVFRGPLQLAGELSATRSPLPVPKAGLCTTSPLDFRHLPCESRLPVVLSPDILTKTGCTSCSESIEKVLSHQVCDFVAAGNEASAIKRIQ